jgi:hypothetical protein
MREKHSELKEFLLEGSFAADGKAKISARLFSD